MREPNVIASFLLGLPLVCAVSTTAQTAVAGEKARAAVAAETAQPPVGGEAAPAPAAGRETTLAPWGGPKSQHFWIDAQAGVESVQLQTFNADFETVSVGLLPASGVGPTANIGAGFRLVFLTLGVRGRVASFQDNAPTRTIGTWQIWTFDGELGLRAPLGRVEPHGALAVGYASFGGLGTAVRGLSAGLDVHGIDGRLEGGVDYWVAHNVSIGADVSGGLLAVARPGVSARDLATPKAIGTINDAKARVLEANGSSVGSMFAVTGDLGVHF
jgi:hypothetical protein